MENFKYIPGDLVRVKNSANWWTKDGAIMKVVAVDCTGMIDVLCGSEYYTVNKSDNIVPVLITSELLEFNEWHSNDKGSYSISDYVDLELEQNGKKWYVIINHYFLAIEIQYVHELQHILFALGLDHSLTIRDNYKNLKTMNDYLELLPNLNEENREIVVDNSAYSYSPNLYKYDGSWVLDWIDSDYNDSLHAETGKSPLQAVKKAYNWCITNNLINT